MKARFEKRTIIGLLIWIGLASVGILYVRQVYVQSPSSMRQLVQYVGNQRHELDINFSTPQILKTGDPVFIAGNDQYVPIGVISKTNGDTDFLTYTQTATITFYGNAPRFRETDFLEYHRIDSSTGWVLQTMLPEEKRLEITALILTAFREHQAEITSAIQPIIRKSLKDAAVVVKQDLAAAFNKRQSRLNAIGQRYQGELMQEVLVPLIQEEIWPIVQEESAPLAADLGQEIWQEVSVFRFGWKYLYDQSPLPKRNLAHKEFERFLDNKIIPILKNHVTDFIELQSSVIQRLSQNKRVSETISESLKTVMSDPDVRQILIEISQEVFLNNPRLKESIERNWNSPSARNAIHLASARLEPTITDIGVALFGSPAQQITPEFARVLRQRILSKDTRWLTLHVADPIESEHRGTPFPKKIEVRIAAPDSQIPYSPARERN